MEYRVSYFFQTALFEMSCDTPGHTPHTVSLFLFPFLFFFFMSVSFVSSFHQVSFVPIIDHTFIFLRLFVFKRIAICRKYILELSRINTFISSPSIFSYVSRISISARYIEAEISSHKPLLSLSLLVCPSIKVTRESMGEADAVTVNCAAQGRITLSQGSFDQFHGANLGQMEDSRVD